MKTELLAYARETCWFKVRTPMMSWLTWWKLQSWSWAPTTCAYQHVFHPKAPKEMIQVLQFFVMPGLAKLLCSIPPQCWHNDFGLCLQSLHVLLCCGSRWLVSWSAMMCCRGVIGRMREERGTGQRDCGPTTWTQ
jgi:hypothetical protein